MNSIQLSIEIRRIAIEMVHKAKASHIGGALSMADILAVLYSDILKIYPSVPEHPERDRLFVSKGHACTSLYAVLALKGFYPIADLDNYSGNGSNFLSHVSHKVPGIEFSAGSLGHAFPVACGVALAGKIKKEQWSTYCIVSDGELDEGSNWEALLFAPHHKLTNLTVIIDYNKIQSFGSVEEVLNLEPLDKKLEAFGWNVISLDGHDHAALCNTMISQKKTSNKPTAIIAHTIKGKGISFMENSLLWHYRSPSTEEFEQAKQQLKLL